MMNDAMGFVNESEIISALGSLSLNGTPDYELGSVQGGSGFYIFHQFAGHFYAMREDTQGNKYGYDLSESGYWNLLEAVSLEYSETVHED